MTARSKFVNIIVYPYILSYNRRRCGNKHKVWETKVPLNYECSSDFGDSVRSYFAACLNLGRFRLYTLRPHQPHQSTERLPRRIAQHQIPRHPANLFLTPHSPHTQRNQRLPATSPTVIHRPYRAASRPRYNHPLCGGKSNKESSPTALASCLVFSSVVSAVNWSPTSGKERSHRRWQSR